MFVSVARLNLGMAYNSLGAKEKALKILNEISSIGDDGLKDPKTHASTKVSSLFNSGKILLELHRTGEALAFLHKAEKDSRTIRNYQSLQGIYNLLGEAYVVLNDTLEAEKWFKMSLKAKPDHVPAFLTYGKLLSKNVSLRINKSFSCVMSLPAEFT